MEEGLVSAHVQYTPGCYSGGFYRGPGTQDVIARFNEMKLLLARGMPGIGQFADLINPEKQTHH